jgi:hypothetical protein
MILNTTKCKTTLIAAVITILTAYSSIAQNVKATASISNNTIKLGQQTQLNVSVTYNANSGKHIIINWSQYADTIRKEIEIVGQSKIDTIIADSTNPYQLSLRKSFLITSFDSGSWTIPPFKFSTNLDSTPVYTEALMLNVSNIAIDTTLSIKDIKPILGVNYTWMDWIKDNVYTIAISLVAIIVIIIIIYYIRKKLKNKPVAIIPEAPKLPPHVIALEKLEKLKNEKLWQEGKLKLYYSSLTDIIREYIENRFKIQAMEQTTEEILYGFRNVAIDEESKNKLKQILFLSDLVKFAKEHPLPHENEMSMTNSYDFISGTMKEEENSVK